jgi:ADP-ribose pyrophosphatase YjhB (NUDIX family)
VEAQPRLPVAVSCFIVDGDGRFLLFSLDGRRWRVMGGQMEEGETVGGCIAREVAEELGAFRYRFLDVLDAHVFDYPGLGPILSIFGLLEYLSGELTLADDMKSYQYRWFTPSELASIEIAVPYQSELVEKARYIAQHYGERPELGFFKFRWAEPV